MTLQNNEELRHLVHIVQNADTAYDAMKFIEAYTHKKLLEGKIEVLEKAHRADGEHEFDNETDTYIDDMIEALTQELEGKK